MSSVEDFALTISLLVRRVHAEAPSEMRDFTWTQKSVLVHLEKGPAAQLGIVGDN